MSSDPDAFIASLVEDLQPVQPLRPIRGFGLVIVTLTFALVMAIAPTSLRSDVATGQPEAMFLVSSGIFLLLGIAAAATAIAMASPRVGNAYAGWGWAAAVAAVLPGAAVVAGAAQGLSSWQASNPAVGIECFARAAALGLATGIALFWWLRRGAPTSPRRAGLLAGTAAGCAGVFALSFSCPDSSILHVGLWHSLAVVVSGFAGWLAGPRLLRW